MARTFNYEIKIGKMTSINGEMPVLRLIVDADDKYNWKGYMMPFRNYSIDICGSREGEMTLGSSNTNDLATIIDTLPSGSASKVVKGFCWEALMNFLKSGYGSNVEIGSHISELDKAFNDFADKVVEYYHYLKEIETAEPSELYKAVETALAYLEG